MSSCKLKAPIPYLGGKRTLAPRIVDMLVLKGTPKHFVEAFHGSAAVLCELRRRGYTCPAIAADTNALVHNLFSVLRSSVDLPLLIERLELIGFHEETYRESVHFLRALRGEKNKSNQKIRATESQNVEIAANFLIASWMGPNDRTGSSDDWLELLERFCKRYNTSGGDPAVRWKSVKDHLSAWHELVCDRTTFTIECGIKLLCKTREKDRLGLCIYVDPPYLLDTRDAKTRYAKEIDDNTDGFLESEDDHTLISAALRGFEKASIVVSYYKHPRLNRLYPQSDGWVHLDAECNKHSANANTPGGTKANEMLIVRNCE